MQSRLNAPRILQVKKVVNYCVSKLAELSVPLMPLDVTWDPDSRLPPPQDRFMFQGQEQQQGQQEGTGSAEGADQQQQQQQAPGPRLQYLELTCNGMAVPCELSVAAVKKFIWRRSDDVLFIYRVLDPASPAPMPVIGPPAA
ncbi:hypothetical protein MNEG_15728 [Monoraphidium neglectum]|uniref:Uncharacterized protein n=1 Tax=Monoraphidium neglectum TaxID=145388 RepID=A0A0D2LQN5_9CHLO|nr:hypothetical protein MNEG_15728 [Monoraphidium neglectum]KIY92236.1 hypothetical protein MNEG_15728 [Monoraphidium neglectum]|eukprot:XP_013891256.1 hypothetical protein MNEG_15728 [Monoraphidium neglectum]